jgi:hypothetical protein
MEGSPMSTDVHREALHDWLDERPALAADERPDPSEYLDEPCDAIDGEDRPYDEADAPEWALAESEQEWRAEMRADAS